MSKISIAIAAGCLMLSGAVSAENWVFYAGNSAKERSYYDADTLQQKGDVIRVWVRRDYSDNDTEDSSARLLLKLDCAEQSYMLLSYVIYKKDNSIRHGTLKAREQEVYPAVPGTIDARLLIVLCRK